MFGRNQFHALVPISPTSPTLDLQEYENLLENYRSSQTPPAPIPTLTGAAVTGAKELANKEGRSVVDQYKHIWGDVNKLTALLVSFSWLYTCLICIQ